MKNLPLNKSDFPNLGKSISIHRSIDVFGPEQAIILCVLSLDSHGLPKVQSTCVVPEQV